MKNKILTTCFVACILLSGGRCLGNNLSIGAASVSGAVISFTISWENSWYASTAPNNWDAAWVFVKYKNCGTTNWQHAILSSTLSTHTVTGTQLQVELPANLDGMGVFIRLLATSTPTTIATATVSLTMTTPASGSFDFQVMGIEMVRALNENFDIGDGTSTGTFSSINITSESAVATGGTGSVATLPASYPKGWNAFYCMKYEITQQQYVVFLNTLTYDQQASRTAIPPSVTTI